MSEKILVIGVGQFGKSVALELSRMGADVTALDSDEERVAAVQGVVSRAVIGDGTDQRVLESLDLPSFNMCVDAIGEESLEASIICAALVGQFGGQRIVARVVGETHGRILSALGVSELIHPESDSARAFAERVMAPGVKSLLNLEEGARLAELELPEAWVGKTLQNLGLRARYGVNVVALRRAPVSGSPPDFVPSPAPDEPLVRGEVMLILGKTDSMDRFLQEISS